MDAGRTPACWPASQITHRASSRSAVLPKTARRTSSSIVALWRTDPFWNRRSVSCIASAIRNPPPAWKLDPGHFDHQPVVGGHDAGGELLGEVGVRQVVGQVREERAARADLL